MAAAPSNAEVFYSGGHYTFAMIASQTTNGGTNWTRRFLPPPVNITRALAVDPVNYNIVYAGGDSVLFKSTNGGANWSNIYAGLRGSVYVLTIDPNAANIVYAGTPYGVYKSTSSGTGWTNTGGSNVRSIVVNPNSTNIVWAATNIGVLRSTTGGGNWTRMNQGLLDSNVTCLGIHPNQYLYASTTASGIYRWALTDIEEENYNNLNPKLKLTTFPNPGQHQIIISYSLPARTMVNLSIFDSQGRLVKNIISGFQDGGHHIAVWDRLDNSCRPAPSSVYFCHLVTPQGKIVHKLVLLK